LSFFVAVVFLCPSGLVFDGPAMTTFARSFFLSQTLLSLSGFPPKKLPKKKIQQNQSQFFPSLLWKLFEKNKTQDNGAVVEIKREALLFKDKQKMWPTESTFYFRFP